MLTLLGRLLSFLASIALLCIQTRAVLRCLKATRSSGSASTSSLSSQ
jgi:hypothetical protein